jgi:hypothetical protein
MVVELVSEDFTDTDAAYLELLEFLVASTGGDLDQFNVTIIQSQDVNGGIKWTGVVEIYSTENLNATSAAAIVMDTDTGRFRNSLIVDDVIVDDVADTNEKAGDTDFWLFLTIIGAVLIGLILILVTITIITRRKRKLYSDKAGNEYAMPI